MSRGRITAPDGSVVLFGAKLGTIAVLVEASGIWQVLGTFTDVAPARDLSDFLRSRGHCPVLSMAISEEQ